MEKFNIKLLTLNDPLYPSEAKIYLNEEQLLIDNRYEPKPKKEDIISTKDIVIDDLDETEKRIIEILLAEGTKILDELSNIINMDKMKLVEKLSLMELEDKVTIQGSMVNLIGTSNRYHPNSLKVRMLEFQ